MPEKIQINGTPPKWNDAEFELRIEDAVKLYKLTTQSKQGVYAPLPHDFLILVAAKVAEGYTIDRNHAVVTDPLHYSCMLIKPERLQEQDIAGLKIKIKGEYVEWLESERTRYQALLRQQLIQKLEEKERKAAETARAKQLAQIESEVQGCYSPLEIPV
ncbi:hypothetical protein [Pseudomonas monteilii]|uniref:Uncharacterized protein n=1 Tax=Pseudomonas monteilii TaxID=76759 RepID=A0AAP7FQY6_9PSED|nr:hypothetical protein [Pseudomonas monteilii]OAH56474.1 hypothetical protein AYJ70_08985 [Pseudomonas monteilii]BBV96689.1 hypothetical protein STW0522PSE72_20400 [Pseudomonas monteilii]